MINILKREEREFQIFVEISHSILLKILSRNRMPYYLKINPVSDV